MPRKAQGGILVTAVGNRERLHGQYVFHDVMRNDPVVGAQQLVEVSLVHAERYRVEGALRRIGDLLMVRLRLGGVGGGGGGGRGRGGRGGPDDNPRGPQYGPRGAQDGPRQPL